MTKLDECFSPKKNVDYEVFQFRQAVQKPGETVNQFATWLRKLAAHCEFFDLERELKWGIIQNWHSKRLWRFALREEALTLDGLLTKARELELSETQASGIEKSLLPENVSRLHQDQGRPPPKPKPVRKHTAQTSVATVVLPGLWCAERVAIQIILLMSVLLPRTRDKTLDRHELISHIQLPNHRFVISLKIDRVPAAMTNTCTHWIKTQRRIRKRTWWTSK